MIRGSIDVMSGATPIQFAHHKSNDRPELHVLHINSYVEIFIYVSGDHSYIVDNSLYKMQRGDIIVINPLEVHKALPARECEYERFFLLIDPRAFEGMSIDPLSGILGRKSGSGNLISLESKERGEVLRSLNAMSECFKDGKNDTLRALSLLLGIIDRINHHIEQRHPSAESHRQTPHLLKAILTYVAENTADIQSTAEIADALGVTPQYLSNYFSKHIGTPLKAYIQTKKIALAKDLLSKGKDVTDTCYDCGFNDCSYFIRVFKKHVGVTPHAFKQANRSGALPQ